MEKDNTFRISILWVCLAMSWLITSAACGSRVDGDTQETSIPAIQLTSTAEPNGDSSSKPTTAGQTPEAGEIEIPTAQPHGTGTTEAPPVTTEPLGTAEPRLGGSQYGRLPSGMNREGEYECYWQITFEDHFSGDRLNTSRWDTGYKAGDKEAQYYVEDAFEFEDGILRIRAEERQVRDREYASGIITTQGKFEQQYGRFEVRAKVPAGQGLWPAFWLMPSSGDWPPEIDVFEILGHDTRRAYMTHRWKDESGENTSETRDFHGPDFSQDFHLFEIEWAPEQIIWRVEGVERSNHTHGIPHEPMFLLLNLAVGGEWPGYPDESTLFPSYLEVDYVRAYTWICPEVNADEVEPENVQTE